MSANIDLAQVSGSREPGPKVTRRDAAANKNGPLWGPAIDNPSPWAGVALKRLQLLRLHEAVEARFGEAEPQVLLLTEG